ncbi:MAG: MBL fold metallo-hydrolase [Ktedonobacteraceae bacterium]|nr:MBL fold metallo-hydrolase [Chloroflexota bacterium]
MALIEEVRAVPEMSGDARVHVFRRGFQGAAEEFEGMEVDAYLVVSERYIVVLDTLLCPEDVAFMMQTVSTNLAGRQVLVINSHADWDHSWGNAYFTGERAAPIIAHDHCLLRMQSEEARAGLTEYQERYAIFHSVVLVPPTVTFEQQLTIHGGDLTIELLATPGHHPDQIAAWLPELRLLLAFDAAEMPLPLIENAACAPLMFASLERMIALQPLRVLCSHGKTTSPEQLQANLAYVREIEQRCQTLLTKRRPDAAELEQGAALIDYPLDEVLATINEPVDRRFYGWAHDNNVRSIMGWLSGLGL